MGDFSSGRKNAFYQCIRSMPGFPKRAVLIAYAISNRDVLQQAVQAKPFQPFRLFVTDGGSYVVQHPELCVIGAQDVFVGLNKAGQTDPDWDDFAMLDLWHVSRWEVIKEPAAPPTGQQATG